jgi:hypothetical protein
MPFTSVTLLLFLVMTHSFRFILNHNGPDNEEQELLNSRVSAQVQHSAVHQYVALGKQWGVSALTERLLCRLAVLFPREASSYVGRFFPPDVVS